MQQRVKVCFKCIAFLLVVAPLSYGQDDSTDIFSSVWEATQRFPNVAVAKTTESGGSAQLSLLIPKNDVFTEMVEQSYTISVPYTEELPGQKTVVKHRTEMRTRSIAIQRCGEMKMRRTSSELGARTVTDFSGQVLDAKSLENFMIPTHVVYGSIPDAYIRSVLNPKVFVVEPIDADLAEETSTAMTRDQIKDPWFREEKVPVVAVAKVSHGKLSIMIPSIDYKADPTSPSQTKASFRMEKNELDLNDCTFESLQHTSLSNDEVSQRLAKPTHVLWESEVAGYLTPVLRSDLLLVNLKEGSNYRYTHEKSLIRVEQPADEAKKNESR